jgi:hypothetical protein
MMMRMLRLAATLATGLMLANCYAKPNGPNSPGAFSHDNIFKVIGSHQNFTCDQCHPSMAPSFSYAAGGCDCFSCHAQADMDAFHSGIPSYSFDFYQCVSCHKTGTAVFDHSSFFPIATGTVHQGIACASCHGATHTTADLQCTACHSHDQATTDTAHAGVTGYVYSSPACYSCHPKGTGGLPANHDTADFPVTGTKHATVGCSQCHGGTSRTLADVTCVPCHDQATSATFHAAIPASSQTSNSGLVTNYQWASAYCLKCHADGQVNTLASHPPVPSGITGENHQPFCLVCHPSLRSAPNKIWAEDFSTYSCLACHSSNNPGN